MTMGVGFAALSAIAAEKAAPAPGPAKSRSFDELAEEAEPVADLASLIDPLFDTCDSSDGLLMRQCEGARSFLESKARGKTYITTGDAASVTVSPYDGKTRQIDVDVEGCISCLHPPKLSDGKGGEVSRFVTTKVPRSIKGGHAVGLDVGMIEMDLTPMPEQAARWRTQEKRLAARLRTQFVFRLGSAWSSGSFSGVSFTPIAYRVVDVCSGEVYGSSGGSSGGASAGGKIKAPVALQPGDNLTCPAPGQDLSPEEKAQREEIAKLPLRLSREATERGMAAVQDRVHDCHVEFEETGTVNLRLVIEGPTGKVKEAHVLAPFDKTPAGLCIRAALRDAKFERFRSDTQEVKLPVYLR
jgi:hypothetical protein